MDIDNYPRRTSEGGGDNGSGVTICVLMVLRTMRGQG